jgi:hypothetical protein
MPTASGTIIRLRSDNHGDCQFDVAKAMSGDATQKIYF